MIQAGTDSNLGVQPGSPFAGRYQVERELGRGGMAVVYLAEDMKHHRRVAIKVLHPELSSSVGGGRFLREIAVAAQLSHPNILALHDSGETGGLLYYVMPYAEGESLRDRLQRERALSPEDALAIVREVAEALEHAHARGIVHRDIKPENILLSGGHALVSDFGIAHAVDVAGGERLTATGIAVGTPAYMSPEQASGMSVDARSDVYSLACVAYEMLGGDPPFTGGSPQAIMARHAIDTPLPLRTVRPTVTEAMDVVLGKALAKVPGDRFATPTQLAVALNKAHATGGFRPFWRPRVWLRQRSHRITAAVAVIAVVALSVVLTRQWLEARAARVTSLAVLPFESLTGDTAQTYFTAGMHDALRGAIGQISGLRVIWGSTNRYRNTKKADTTVARELSVDALVHASILRAGDSVHLQVRFVQTRPVERLLWSHAYDREIRGALTMHGEIAREIARATAAELTPSARNGLARPRPVDAEAYEAYLRGTFYLSQPGVENHRRGLSYFERAVEKNPADALAYAGLASAYATSAHSPSPLPDALEFGRAAALRAISLDSTLAEGWAALAMIKLYLEWDWAGAERAFRKANEINPNLAANHYHYAWYLVLFDRMDEAIAEHKLAQEQDPFNAAHTANLGDLYALQGHYDQAIAEARKVKSENVRREGYALALLSISGALAAQGKHEQALVIADSARLLFPRLSFGVAIVHWRAGQPAKARGVLAEVERLPMTPMVALNRALINGVMGNNDEYFRWIRYEPHHAWVPWIRISPGWTTESIRRDPRFAEEMRRMNLPMPRVAQR